MSADELRKAAETLRREWGGQTNARLWPTASRIHLELADWLDAQAEHVASHDCEAHCAYPNGCQQTQIALRVAALINDEPT